MKKYNLQMLTFVTVGFLLGCNEYLVVGITSDIARDYQVPLAVIGTIVTAFAMTYVVATPLLSALTARFNRFKVLMVSMGVFLIGNTMTAWAPTLPLLFASRIITATVAGLIISLILVYGSIIVPIEKRSMMVAVTYSGYNIATVIGVPLGTMLTVRLSWQASFWIISGLTIFVTMILYKMLPKQTEQHPAPVTGQLTLLKDRRIICGVIIIVMTYASQYSFYTFIRPEITEVLRFGEAGLNLILSLTGVMFIVGNFLAGLVSSRYGATKMLAIELLSLVILVFMPLSFHFAWAGVVDLSLICIIMGMPSSILQVMFLNIAQQDYPSALNLASSLDPLFCNVGVTLGSLTISFGINYLPLINVGYVGAAFAFIGVGAALVLNKANKKIAC